MVTGIYPAAATLPVNALRLYIEFCAPMSAGFAAQCVALRDESSGEVLAGALLAMPPELWDPRRTRLTVLLDPGRIKRGLVPQQEAGYPLTPGRGVVLTVSADFPDAAGTPLRAAAQRRFLVGPAIRRRLDPQSWQVSSPQPGTRAPLRVRFGRPVDHALGLRCLSVTGSAGQPVPGEASLAAGEEQWSFRPARPWPAGPCALVVAPELEDVAGNSVRRVFDRDLTSREDDPGPAGPVALPLPASA